MSIAQISRLKDDAKRSSTLADEAFAAGDYKKATALMEEANIWGKEAHELQVQADTFKRLRGDFNAMVNSVPLTELEAKAYDKTDTTAKFDANYRPAGWVKSIDGRPLSAAIQPAWVRDQMGDNHKRDAHFYKDTWQGWFRARNQNAWLADASAEQRKAMQENTDVEGGFFVPEDYRTIVLHDPGAVGGVHRPLCTVVTTSLKDGYFPTIGSVLWQAIAEEGPFPDNTPAVGQVPFNVAKSGGKVDISAELLEDAATNLPALLAQIFNEARGRYEDTKIIAGSGTGEPQGLRTALGAGQTVTLAGATAIVAADVTKIYWSLPAQFRRSPGVAWSLTSALMAQIENIGSTSPGVHFIGQTGTEPNNPGAPMDTLRGRRVVTYDDVGWDDATAIATTEVIGAIGDFKQYYLIDRIGMSLRRDDSIASANDQVRFYARSRFDGRVGLVNAFRLIKAA
jgi:HK97 family phage major capsid protein